MDCSPCPRYGDNTTVAGWADLPDHARSFRPDGHEWPWYLDWTFGETTHLRLPERFRAGLACELIWNSLPPVVRKSRASPLRLGILRLLAQLTPPK